jgi:hypothetical protein
MKRQTDEAPDWACLYCWEKGLEVEADSDDGELCLECEFEKQVGQADLLYDLIHEN